MGEQDRRVCTHPSLSQPCPCPSVHPSQPSPSHRNHGGSQGASINPGTSGTGAVRLQQRELCILAPAAPQAGGTEAQDCAKPQPCCSHPGPGLTVGWLLQLCCGGGQAGGRWHWCTGALGVPGLPAVVAELGATALTATGEAGTLGTAMGKDSVAVGTRQLGLGYSRAPLPAQPGQAMAVPVLH